MDDNSQTWMSVRIPTELRDWLAERAEGEDRSMSSIVRLALQEYKDRSGKSSDSAA